MAVTSHPTKLCATCGRRFEWRKAWRNTCDGVRYCSKRCRGERPGHLDRRLEAAIVSLLDGRGATSTICPSKAAREVEWRPLMERTRRAGRRMVADGRLEVLQRGRVVDATTARGPIRYRPRHLIPVSYSRSMVRNSSKTSMDTGAGNPMSPGTGSATTS